MCLSLAITQNKACIQRYNAFAKKSIQFIGMSILRKNQTLP